MHVLSNYCWLDWNVVCAFDRFTDLFPGILSAAAAESGEESMTPEQDEERVRAAVDSVWAGFPTRCIAPYRIERQGSPPNSSYTIVSQIGTTQLVIGAGGNTRIPGREGVTAPAVGETHRGGEQVVKIQTERAARAAAEATFPPVWIADEESTHCTLCAGTFAVLRRRHHCRNCGSAVCDHCSGRRWPAWAIFFQMMTVPLKFLSRVTV